MTRPIVDYLPFDYLVANIAKYDGVTFDIKTRDGQVDFTLKTKDGAVLDRFETYPLVAMFVDTQLREHPAFQFVDAILADYDKAWKQEYPKRVGENN